ncbi:NADP oxidoreductase coenzyme F420-dependent [Nocardia brasiliensis ATCC 700358]|uniref:NADP oxidoreductase coenzyme F420-dependent n=2 Tax=Nocardia brasiliensis TaxID=37326 RepID=K0ENE1_NOCB7|nr:NADP oxidoreductase coenzyme F420-dependent [Nocardia brasiliensis ATCC 700358]
MIGGTLARLLAANGYEVVVANSGDPAALTEEFADLPGIEPVWARVAATDTDLTIVSVPYAAVPRLARTVFADTAGPAVLDTGNYFPQRDLALPGFDTDTVDSVWVAHQLGRTVYKAFNTIHAFLLEQAGRPAGAPDRIALPVAGPVGAEKRGVLDLVDAVGFDPVDAGELETSWRQHMDTPVFLAELEPAGVRAALDRAEPQRPDFIIDPARVAAQDDLARRWHPSERLRAGMMRAYGIAL